MLIGQIMYNAELSVLIEIRMMFMEDGAKEYYGKIWKGTLKCPWYNVRKLMGIICIVRMVAAVMPLLFEWSCSYSIIDASFQMTYDCGNSSRVAFTWL